jgi:hypothetical protein
VDGPGNVYFTGEFSGTVDFDPGAGTSNLTCAGFFNDVFVCKLRKKLANASGGKNYIETMWGRGYVLREPTEQMARLSA